MNELHLIKIRRESRYEGVPGTPQLLLELGDSQLSIEDISASAARVRRQNRSFSTESHCRLLLDCELPLEIGGERIGKTDGPTLSLLESGGNSRSVDLVMFDEKARQKLRELLPGLAIKGVISDNQEVALTKRFLGDREIESLIEGARKWDEIPAETIKKWINLNQRSVARLGPGSWPLLHKAMLETFENSYIGEELFARYLRELLRRVRNKGFSEIHAVPMRPPIGLKMLFEQHDGVFRKLNVNWHPNLWEFLAQAPGTPGDSGKSCLVAIDAYLNLGISRRQFLKLVAASKPEMLANRFNTIFLGAVAGHGENPPFETEAAMLSSFGITVEAIVAHKVATSRYTGAWQDFLRKIDREVCEQAPRSVVFYFGAPMDAVPLYWKRCDDWTPLFRPSEHYSAGHRPIPRIPFFRIYPKTLNWLRSQVDRGGSVLLYGPQGCGKTELAARLAENCRPSCYIFWYECRGFDTVENIVEDLDVFLDALGIQIKLSSFLRKPIAEEILANELIKCLRKLDRPALLIIDGFQNIDRSTSPDSAGVSALFTLFVKCLIGAMASSDAPAVSAPFLLVTYNEATPDSVNIAALRQALGIKAEDSVYCPVDSSDVLRDVVPLARNLINNPSALEHYAGKVELLSHNDLYKTWLLCYWINRCVRRAQNQLSSESRSQIDAILDERCAIAFSNVDTLHAAIHQRLEGDERYALQTAAVWPLPWSVGDLQEILSRQLKLDSKQAVETIKQFLEDRAPFLALLSQSVQDQTKLFSAPLQSESRAQELYEMPSIAAKFFERCWKDSPVTSGVYRGIAAAMDQRLKEIKRLSSNEFSSKRRKTTLMVEAILCLCKGNKPSEAARRFASTPHYRELRELNPWDRLLQMGKAILDAADRSEDAELTLEMQCETAVIHANALTEALMFREAREVCDQYMNCTKPSEYWYCRLRLVKAKCLRYENKYQHALRELSEIYKVLGALLPSPSDSDGAGVMVSDLGRNMHEVAAWVGRTLMATAQCHMGLGQLSDAEEVLESVGQFYDRMAPDDVTLLKGLTLRHRGTIQQLRGYIFDSENASQDTAGKYFRDLEQAVHSVSGEQGTRVRAIARYKLARVLIERVFVWESPLLWGQGVDEAHGDVREFVLCGAPEVEEVCGWIVTAREYLGQARLDLRELHQGDRKWFPAIDLWEANAQLLEVRLRGPSNMREDSQLSLIADVVERVIDRTLSREGHALEVRKMDIQSLQNSLACEREISNQTSVDRNGFVAKLVNELNVSLQGNKWAEQESWDSKDPNPFKNGRTDYERMYYLWRASRLAKTVPHESQGLDENLVTEQKFLQAAAWMYRRGTSVLYGHNMFRSAAPLHHLALACFADNSTGLQELLEAAACLERAAPVGIEYVLDRIVLESLRWNPEERDEFYTIPTKVVCRLVGDHSLYLRVAQTGSQPHGIPGAAVGRDNDLITIANRLALRCYTWLDKTINWEEKCRKARLQAAEATRRRKWAEDKVELLRAWLDKVLVEKRGPSPAVH